MIVMYVIVDIALIIIISAIIFLMIPVKYSVRVLIKDKHISYSFRMEFFFNMIIAEAVGSGKHTEVDIRILFFKKKLNMEGKKAKGFSKNFNIYDFLVNAKEYEKYLKNILDRLKPNCFKIDGKYGFSDPYDTGMLAGFIFTVKPFLKVVSIDLKPNFFGEELYINMGICGRIRPISIMNFGGILWILKKMQRRFFQSLRISLKQKPS
ncbi:DUF2953 domain-containing protein [Clostridium sp. LBM24168]